MLAKYGIPFAIAFAILVFIFNFSWLWGAVIAALIAWGWTKFRGASPAPTTASA